MRLNRITLPAQDVAACRDLYLALGFSLIVDGKTTNPDYVRLLAPFEAPALPFKNRMPCLREQEPSDHNRQWREAWAKDPAGNRVCFHFAGQNRLYPPRRVR